MPKSVSERLAQEDKILREIRLSLSSFRTMDSVAPRRKGVAYASAPITSGYHLYRMAREHGFTDAAEFRRAMPVEFRKHVFLPNLQDGKLLGDSLRNNGWPQVIVPGRFFADGWAQEHYMSLWRQVIVRHTRTIVLACNWPWSLGCTEEFLIGLQHQKTVLQDAPRAGYLPLPWEEGLVDIRRAMDDIDKNGFDVKPHYELWRQATLTLEALRDMTA